MSEEDLSLEFASLGLAEPILRAVAEKGYTKMSPIQAQAIPVVLSGRDVMGAAQTGTGKTAAFTLPLLQRMMPHASHSMSPARQRSNSVQGRLQKKLRCWRGLAPQPPTGSSPIIRWAPW